jgi:hypothetical protein
MDVTREAKLSEEGPRKEVRGGEYTKFLTYHSGVCLEAEDKSTRKHGCVHEIETHIPR